MLSLLFRLGFIVNKEKSSLVPSQDLTYIGGHFLLTRGLEFPTQECAQGLRKAALDLLHGQNSAHSYLVLLGKIASCVELIPNARLFMRPIQLHLLKNWSSARMNMKYQIPVIPSLRPHFEVVTTGSKYFKESICSVNKVYRNSINRCESVWLGWSHEQSDSARSLVQLTENVSHQLSGDGGSFSDIEAFSAEPIGEECPDSFRQPVSYPVFEPSGWNQVIGSVSSDMEAVVIGIGTNICLKVIHIAGKKNTLADCLSRHSVREGMVLNKAAADRVFYQWTL